MYRTRFELDVSPDPRAATLRWLTLFALVAYPVGAALEWGFATVASSIDLVGSALRISAVIAAMLALGSRLQKVAGGQRQKLDEFELSHRREAIERAYPVFAGAVLLAFIYLGVSLDLGWWRPSTVEDWQIIAFYFALLALLLPTTVLVWSKRSDTLEAADPEGK